MYNVFVSYRREGGAKIAEEIVGHLKERGYSPFYDKESIRTGKFNEQIFTEIAKCPNFIVILPPNSLDRCMDVNDWVRAEISHALKEYSKDPEHRRIIPIMLPGFEFPKTLPSEIDDLKNFHGISPEDFILQQLMDKLETMLYNTEILSVKHLCPECKSELSPDLHFCRTCGYKIPEKSSTGPKESMTWMQKKREEKDEYERQKRLKDAQVTAEINQMKTESQIDKISRLSEIQRKRIENEELIALNSDIRRKEADVRLEEERLRIRGEAKDAALLSIMDNGDVADSMRKVMQTNQVKSAGMLNQETIVAINDASAAGSAMAAKHAAESEREFTKRESDRSEALFDRMEHLADKAVNNANKAVASQVSCPSCGTKNPAGSKFCGNCGSKLN